MQKDPSTENTKDREETSSKTLHEIERDEDISDSRSENASTPSPDGQSDESDKERHGDTEKG